jgi:hypothetical protein
MIDENANLIPPPPAVRDRLARNIRERRLLRALLRLSIRAAEENECQEPHESRLEAAGRGGSHEG